MWVTILYTLYNSINYISIKKNFNGTTGWRGEGGNIYSLIIWPSLYTKSYHRDFVFIYLSVTWRLWTFIYTIKTSPEFCHYCFLKKPTFSVIYLHKDLKFQPADGRITSKALENGCSKLLPRKLRNYLLLVHLFASTVLQCMQIIFSEYLSLF